MTERLIHGWYFKYSGYRLNIDQLGLAKQYRNGLLLPEHAIPLAENVEVDKTLKRLFNHYYWHKTYETV